jgi:hypothetical protein
MKWGVKIQHLEPLTKLHSGSNMRQGTTSVVPQMANLDSSFSRCGIAKTQGLKPSIILLLFRHD